MDRSDTGDCSARKYTVMPLICYYGSLQSKRGMRGGTEIDVVIGGRMRTCYLWLTHTLFFKTSPVLRRGCENRKYEW